MFSVIIGLNGFLGALCGLWFRLQILVPLIAAAVIEAVLLKGTGTGCSALWTAIVLICTVEIGYLLGSALVVFWPTLKQVWSLRSASRSSHALRKTNKIAIRGTAHLSRGWRGGVAPDTVTGAPDDRLLGETKVPVPYA
jgi:hypothetical protein